MASQINKEYFDNEAASYDQKHEKTQNKLLEEVRARIDFIGADWVDDSSDDSSSDDEASKRTTPPPPKRQVRMLDYACGTGILSRALAPFVTQCVGFDVSSRMVAKYNARASNQGLAPDEMQAYQGDLLNEKDPNPAALADPEKFFNFDIAACGLGFHHFDNPSFAAKQMVGRLKPGGVFVLLDFLPHSKMESTHPASHTVTHHGFGEEVVRQLFKDAGADKDFRMESFAPVVNIGTAEKPETVKRTLFLARGVKR